MKNFLLFLFSHNSLYFLKIDLHFLLVRIRNLIYFKNTNRIKKNASFLNIGCGVLGVDSEEWFNLDGWPAKGVDYQCDFHRNLPFADCRFHGIYSEHFLEHLSQDDANKFLDECFRILKPGGTIRFSVPDGELYLKNYLMNRPWMIEQIEGRGWMHKSGGKSLTPIELINDVFRQKLQHQYCYDFETLSKVLSEANFKDIIRAEFSSGYLKDLQIDREDRRVESLYVEGQKPE